MVYAIIHSEDIKPADTNDNFNVTLRFTQYNALIIKDDSNPTYRISRSELIESYNESQKVRVKNMNQRKKQVISQADTVSDAVILRHLFKKNISSPTDAIVSIAVPVPASLKDRCAKWFCTIHVPVSCISAEPAIGKTELVALTLTQETCKRITACV